MFHKTPRRDLEVKARTGTGLIEGTIVGIKRKFEDFHQSFTYQIKFKNADGQTRYIWLPDYRVQRLSDGEWLANIP